MGEQSSATGGETTMVQGKIWFDTGKMLIGGQWRPASNDGTLDLFDPSDGSPLCQIARGTAEDIHEAVGRRMPRGMAPGASSPRPSVAA
jgi:hypothetical protein